MEINKLVEKIKKDFKKEPLKKIKKIEKVKGVLTVIKEKQVEKLQNI